MMRILKVWALTSVNAQVHAAARTTISIARAYGKFGLAVFPQCYGLLGLPVEALLRSASVASSASPSSLSATVTVCLGWKRRCASPSPSTRSRGRARR